MPLLELLEPGLWTSVGVSKPAGASVGACGALPAARGICRPVKATRTAADLLIIMFPSRANHMPSAVARIRAAFAAHDIDPRSASVIPEKRVKL